MVRTSPTFANKTTKNKRKLRASEMPSFVSGSGVIKFLEKLHICSQVLRLGPLEHRCTLKLNNPGTV